MFNWPQNLTFCAAVVFAVLTGCAEDNSDVVMNHIRPVEAGSSGLAASGVVPSSSHESDAAAGAANSLKSNRSNRSPGSDSGESSERGAARRESIEIKPYNGPPIFLEEPPAPPPATVVERQVSAPPQKYPDGSVHIDRQVTKYSDNQLVNDGNYREYFPDGQKFVEGEYALGSRVGQWTYWHENGQKNRTITYVDGMPDGSWDVYRADGTLEAKRTFKAGRRHGEWTEYNDTGDKPLRIMNYRDGKPHGEWKQWFPSGVQESVITYRDGKQNGPYTEWDADGNKRIEANYVDGKLHGQVIRWSDDGTKVVQQYKENRLVAESNE